MVIHQPNRTQKRDHEGGFTMVEMLVALVLVTIVLSGTLAVQVSMMQGNRKAMQTTAAITLAQRHVESFQTSHYEALTATPYTYTCYSIDLKQTAITYSCPEPWSYRVLHAITGDTLNGFRLYVNIEERTPESSDTSKYAYYEYRSYYYSERFQ